MSPHDPSPPRFTRALRRAASRRGVKIAAAGALDFFVIQQAVPLNDVLHGYAGTLLRGLSIAILLVAAIGVTVGFALWVFERVSSVLYRSRPTHQCQACGYDLKGLPPGAVCPECGGAEP